MTPSTGATDWKITTTREKNRKLCSVNNYYTNQRDFLFNLKSKMHWKAEQMSCGKWLKKMTSHLLHAATRNYIVDNVKDGSNFCLD